MNKTIIKRVYDEANYIITTKNTVRETAKVFKVSKSTVHKDLQERLMELDKKLHSEVLELFKEHVEIRHLRGGESTRIRYLKLKEG